MFKELVVVLTISHIFCCAAAENATGDAKPKTSYITERKSGRANLVSFESVGEHIQLGLDFLLPFLNVPIARNVDAYGNEPALININTAALVSTGLLAVCSALVSAMFRRYAIFAREESSAEKRRRHDDTLEYELLSIVNNFKLVYTNSTGAKVDTSLAELFETFNETFEANGAHLSSCIQKAICTRIHVSAQRVNAGDSSAVDKIIDGLLGINWVKHFLRHSFLKEAIETRNVSHQQHKTFCNIKYPQCKWFMPADFITDIIRTYLKFT